MSIIYDFDAIRAHLPQPHADVDFLTRLGTFIADRQYYSWKPVSARARSLVLQHFADVGDVAEVLYDNKHDGWLLDVGWAHDSASFVELWSRYPDQLRSNPYAQTLINDRYVIQPE